MNDARIEAALKEIRDVLCRHDLAASIQIVSDDRSATVFHVDASWSVLSYTGPRQLKMTARIDDFASAEQHARCVGASIRMIQQLRDMHSSGLENFQQMLDTIFQHFGLEQDSACLSDIHPTRQ